MGVRFGEARGDLRPFLNYEIDEQGEEIVWTTTGGLGAAEMTILEEFLGGDESAAGSSSDAIAQRLEQKGLDVIA